MENRISASQAHSIASGEYEKMMSIRVGEFLNEVYKGIRRSSEGGMFETSVNINIFGNEYRDGIAEVLELDGYKARYDHRYYDSQDYITVSWRTPTH
jgi:hypothetical protein